MVSVNSVFGGGRNSFTKRGRFLIAAALILVSGFFVVYTPNALAATTLFSDGFESGNFNAWNIHDAHWSVTTGNAHNASAYKAEAKGDTGPTDDLLQKNISTVGYYSINLSYWFRIISLDNTDHVYVEYSTNGGVNWQQLADYTNRTADIDWVNASYNLPSTADNNANFVFRFRVHTNSNNDIFYLDDVSLTGTPIPSATNSTFSCLPLTQSVGNTVICNILVKDQNNISIAGIPVLLNSSGTGNYFSTNPVVTDASGSATIFLGSTVAETKSVYPLIGNIISLTPQSVTFTAGSAQKANITATPKPQEANLSGSDVALTIAITDNNGNPVNQGIAITVSGTATTPGTVTVLGNENPTDNQGKVYRTLRFNNKGDVALKVNNVSWGDLNLTGDTIIHFVDTTKPVITVLGDNPATVEFRTSYTDAGATATDNIDGDITSNIVVSGLPIDTSVINVSPIDPNNKIVATHTVTYDVKDSSNNSADQKTRTVKVVDTTKPVITSITSNATSSGVLGIGGTITFTLTTQQDEPGGWSINGSYNGRVLLWARGIDNHTFVATYIVTEGDPDRTTPLQIAGVTMTDEAGNVSEPASGTDIQKTIDAHRPTVVSVDSDGKTFNLSTSSPQTIKITFNEDISVTPTVKIGSSSQAVGDCSDSDAKTFCFDYTIPSSTDRTTMTIDISGAKDLAGNEMVLDNSHTFIVDTVKPVLTEKTPVSTPTNDNTPDYIFTSTEAGTITYAGSCGNGNLSSAGVGDNTTTYGPLADGTYNNCTIVVTDAAGNPSEPLTVSAFTVDTVRPTVTISSNAPNPTHTSPIPVTATFSENVTGFELGDITVGNGAAGNFVAVNGRTYTFDVTPSGDGQVTVNIAAGVAHDAAGNGNTAGTFSIVYDTTPPTVVLVELKEGANVSDGLVKAGDVLTINVTFSEDMAISPAPQISIAGANTLTATNMTRVDATHYTYNFTVGSGNGTATITIANGRDLAGNTQVPNSSTTFTVDNTAPVIDQHDPIVDVANATGGKIITYTVTANDSHDGAIILICSPVSGFFFPVSQTTTVTCNATDQAGNAATPKTFNVTINPDVITHIVLTASPVNLAFDQTSLITVTGKDQYENVVTNNNSTVVVLSADGGGSLDDTILTLSGGVATTHLSKDSAGIVHVTASSDGLTPQSVTVTFTEVDTSQPYVESHTPADGTTGVALNLQPRLIFSEPLDTTTVNSANIQLRKYSDDSPVPAIVSPAEGDRQVIISPLNPLESNTQYYFAVSSGVKDKVGNPAVVLNASNKDSHEFTTVVIQPVVVDEIIAQNNYVVADNTYINGWHYIFRITINTNETNLYVKFADWVNSADSTVAVNGNTRLLFNTAGGGIGAGVGLTNSDIENGFGSVISCALGNNYIDQTCGGSPSAINVSGIDNSTAPGRQIQFDVFTKIPTTTAPGFYTTTYGVKVE